MHIKAPIIALTPGEPAGIGPDLAIKQAQQNLATAAACHLVLIVDPELITQRAGELGLQFDIPTWTAGSNAPVSIFPVKTITPVKSGHLDPLNSPYVIDALRLGAEGCQRGEFDALVTGPIHKGVINEAGIPFTGHTEYLAEKCAVDNVVMMLVTEKSGETLRVGLATTHLALKDVSAALTQRNLRQTIGILDEDLKKIFGITRPRILVCGLNPHAGESGYLGREEIEVMQPVIDQLRSEGLILIGPVPADTAFTPPMLAQADVVLAMYHDQGLPVLKYAGFGQAVNVTLGLPIIRTSVDHGTALELAGTGNIDSGSLNAAVSLACKLAKN